MKNSTPFATVTLILSLFSGGCSPLQNDGTTKGKVSDAVGSVKTGKPAKLHLSIFMKGESDKLMSSLKMDINMTKPFMVNVEVLDESGNKVANDKERRLLPYFVDCDSKNKKPEFGNHYLSFSSPSILEEGKLEEHIEAMTTNMVGTTCFKVRDAYSELDSENHLTIVTFDDDFSH